MMHRHSMYAMMLATTTHDDNDILSPTSILNFPNHSISNTIAMELPLRFGYVHDEEKAKQEAKSKEIDEIEKINKSNPKVVGIMDDDNNINNINNIVQDYDQAVIIPDFEETQYWNTILNWDDSMPLPDLP